MTDDFTVKEDYPHAPPRLIISEGTRSKIKELVKEKWPTGLSVQEIAIMASDLVALPISKNMVSGIVHRLGLDKRPSPIKMAGRPKEWSAKRLRKQKFNPTPNIKPQPGSIIKKIWFAGAKAEKPEPKPTIKRRPALNPIPMEALRSDTCRWPEWGDERPTFMYCGDKVAKDRQYCPHHCHFAFKPRFTQEGKTDNGTDSQATADGTFGETDRMVRQELARVPSDEASSGASEVGTGE